MSNRSDIRASLVHEDTIIAAGAPWSGQVREGNKIRIIDLEGRQAVDFLCYSADQLEDRYNAANTIKLNNNIYLGEGSVLWSVRARKLMTITEDTCGSHDTIYGCCSIEVDDIRFGKNNGNGCQQNFERELARHGLGEKDIPDGAVAIAEGLSKGGDYVDLQAEMDVLAVLSNCPESMNNAAGFKPTPIRVVVYSP